VVADPSGAIVVNPTGGPLLATGGTGDVLAGAIGGLLAQGLAAPEAAALGVFVHGAAADALSAARGPAGVLAGEVAGALPDALLRLLDDPSWNGEPDHGPQSGDRLAFPEPR
jgi:NAD(P)H-hydrate epimerase